MNAQLFDVISSGKAFTNPLTSLSSTSVSLISDGKAATAFITSATDPSVQAALAAGGLTPQKLESAGTMFTSAGAGVTTLVTYGDRSIGEAYQRIGTSHSYKQGLKGIGREPNNCDLMNKAFGVVQKLGKQFLSAIETAVKFVTDTMNQLKELIEQGISAGLAKIQELAGIVAGYINQAQAAIAEVVQNIENAIAEELAHIESMIKSCLDFSFANVISEWFKDPCAAGVINTVGTKELNDTLK